MSKNILFNKLYITNQEISNIRKIFTKKLNSNFGYQGYFSEQCVKEIKKITKAKNVSYIKLYWSIRNNSKYY